MKTKLFIPILTLLLLLSNVNFANTINNNDPEKDKVLISVLNYMLTRGHFVEKQMDDNFSEIFAQYVVNDVIWDDFGMEGHRAYCEFIGTNLIALLPPFYPKNS